MRLSQTVRGPRAKLCHHLGLQAALGLALLGSLVSCGAATALDFDPPTKDAKAPSPNDNSEPKDPKPQRRRSEAEGNGAKGDDSDIDLPTFELPDCELGPTPNLVKECPYLADGLCYNDVESACACVCSRDVDSFCLEGLFLNIWNGVDVSCAER